MPRSPSKSDIEIPVRAESATLPNTVPMRHRGDAKARLAVRRWRGAALFLVLSTAAVVAWRGAATDVGTAAANAKAGPAASRARAKGPGVAETMRLTAGNRVLLEQNVGTLRSFSWVQLARRARRVPATHLERRGDALVTVSLDRARFVSELGRALREGGDAVSVGRRLGAASVRLPLVKQALRNNCETATLSMLLAARGLHVAQLELQRRLRRSGRLDPVFPAAGGLPIWGDPEVGFVGRPNGGGTSGGYGVYQAPIRALAARFGVELVDLTGRSSSAIYRRLLAGHPVMVWVGLSNGPYKMWRTPQGKLIRANLGEHTVVLTSIRGSSVTLNDPLSGQRASWTRAYFEQLWQRLGRRALST